MRLGWPEILLILVIVMIVFGVGKLPQIGSGFGKAIREFRKSQQDAAEEDKKQTSTSSGSNGSKPEVVSTQASVVVSEPSASTPGDDLAATQARLAAAEARIKELEASKKKA